MDEELACLPDDISTTTEEEKSTKVELTERRNFARTRWVFRIEE